MGLYEEGIRQAKEAFEIFERLGHVVEQAHSLIKLASLLRGDGQLDAAEEAGSRALDLLPEKGEEFRVCYGHRVLGQIYLSKSEAKKAIHHFEKALGIASSLNMVDQLVWINLSLADVFSKQGEFEDAQTHLERAKSHAGDNAYVLAYVMDQQALVWYEQRMFEEARSEALRALNIFEKLGAANNAEFVRNLLQHIDARRAGQPG
jgi:tetratricopeptide (TPR) repeat protein